MKPPVVHQPVQPPAPSGDDQSAKGAAPDAFPASPDARRDVDPARPEAPRPGLVGSLGPLVGGGEAPDRDGAGADERRRP